MGHPLLFLLPVVLGEVGLESGGVEDGGVVVIVEPVLLVSGFNGDDVVAFVRENVLSRAGNTSNDR